MKAVILPVVTALLMVFMTAGCESVDRDPPGCADDDGDGYGVGEACLGTDCDESDATINPGADEIAYDGADNDCDSTTPDDDLDGDGYLEAVDCDDEDAQVNPGAEEECMDGVDNDCNGFTDTDDLVCKSCQYASDCDDGNPCTQDYCIAGFCEIQLSPDGAACDDGLYCTIDDACQAGVCRGTADDCDDFDDCTDDTCNENADRCENILELRPGEEGVNLTGTCDNMIDDDCDGLTDYDDPNCSSCSSDAECDDGNECTMDTCSDSECSNVPLADGVPCDDGWYCTVGDICQNGQCPPGTPRECDDSERCTVDACDEANAMCQHTWVPQPGTEGIDISGSCDNNIDDDCDTLTDAADPNCWECTLDSECDDGNACTDDICEQSQCKNEFAPDGTACDDGFYCTKDDVCNQGLCFGMQIGCEELSDDCNTGVCDEVQQGCMALPYPDGTACEDGLFCTVQDVCVEGECYGAGRDCSDLTDDCNLGVCDEELDQCIAVPVNGNLYCDDGDPCTLEDHCSDGICQGTPVVCPENEICVNGECLCGNEPGCFDPETCCGGQCVNTDWNESHCGECFYDCLPNQQCHEGVCSDTFLDLNGVWAERFCQNEEYTIALGSSLGTRVTIMRVTLDQAGTDIVERAELCDIEVPVIAGAIQLTYPPALIDSNPMIDSFAVLDSLFPGAAYITVGDPAVQLTAWNPVGDPVSDPIPTDPSDPRVYDQDGDGFVGATVDIESFLFGEGQIYIVGRVVRSSSGIVVSNDEISGDLDHVPEQVTLDASDQILMLNAVISPLEGSTFQKARIDPFMACYEIVEAADWIFDGPCPPLP